MRRYLLPLLMLTLVMSQAARADEPATPSQVRSSIEKSLPFLEKKGADWFDKNKCIACHHGEWLMWSMNEARHAGISIDTTTYDTLTNRVIGIYTDNASKKKTDHVQSMYMLLSQYDPSTVEKDAPEWMKTAVSVVTAAQRTEGSWKYAGQGLDRPDAENDEMTTLWALLALPSDATATREKALAWQKGVKQGPSIDSLALRLALEARFGDASKVPALRDELIARQNANGGFSWRPTRASEAFATGEVLYVLSLAGTKSDSPVIRKAWTFLVSTQKEDGSWLSPTRKPKGGNVISSYWGTSWAVIGMSRTLPPAAKETAQTSSAR